MKLTSLHLENFRCHGELDIPLKSGVTAMVGANESGKSSILEAIGFALYGSRAIRGSVASLKRRGYGKMRVALTFVLDGLAYSVVRTESDARVSKKGFLVCKGKKECDAHIAELIGMEWPEFRASVLCQQHDLQRMVSMTPAERSAFVRRVMGVEAVDRGIKTTRAREREVRATLAAMPPKRVASAARGRVKHCEQVLLDRKSTLARQVAALESAEAALPTDAESAGVEKATEMARAVGSLKSELDDVVAEIEANDVKLNPPPEEGEADRLLKEINQGLAEALHQREAYRVACAKLEEAKRNAASKSCVACGRPFDAASESEARRQLQRARQRRDEEETRYVPDHAKLQVRRNAIIDYEEKRGRMPALRARAAKLNDELDLKTSKLIALEKKVEMARQIERGRGVISSLRAEIDGSRARIEAIEEGLANARDTLETILAEDLKRTALQAQLADLDRAVTVSDEFRTALLGRIRPELEELASGLMSVLTDGRHEAVELDENFSPVVYEDGAVSHVVSGGTMDCLGLAMRLALGQMIAQASAAPLECLILDEPFGSLDGVRRQNVLNLLDRIRDTYPQVVLVSHVAETKDMADHVLNL